MAIRFDENDVRVMGRNASGVKGITLPASDRVVGMVKSPEDDKADLLTVTERGYGKCTALHEYLIRQEDGSTRPQGRGGKGRADIKTTQRNGQVVAIQRVAKDNDLMLITLNGMIVRINAGSISRIGRNTQGVRVINVEADDRLVALALVAEEDANETPASVGRAN